VTYAAMFITKNEMFVPNIGGMSPCPPPDLRWCSILCSTGQPGIQLMDN